MKLRFAYLAAILVALLARPVPVWACSCAMPGTPAQAYSQAQAVFVGTVTGVRNNQTPGWLAPLLQRLPGYQFPSPVQAEFNVSAAYKGLTVSSVVVNTGAGDADCGYAFAPGGQYVVYTYGQDGGQYTNICMRTSDVAYAVDDLAYLQTLTPLALAPASAAFPWPLLAVGAVALVVVAALAALAWGALRKGRAA